MSDTMDIKTENNRYTIVRYRGIGIFDQETDQIPRISVV